MAYNILKRPGFRKGGIANLEPRQGYADKGSVQKIEDLMAQRRQAYETAAQPTGGELALLLASAIGKKPGGNIGEIAGEVSTQLQPLFTKKKEIKAKLAGQDIEDLISLEKLKAYQQRYAIGPTNVFSQKQAIINSALNEIGTKGTISGTTRTKLMGSGLISSRLKARENLIKLYTSGEAGALTNIIDKKTKEPKPFSELTPAERNKFLDEQIKIWQDQEVQDLFNTKIALQNQQATSNADTSTDELTKKIEDAFSDGGRAGYAQGSMVQAQPAQASMTANQVQDSKYTELRSRLPKEISNDIVQLIAYNESAFQDFASIQSQADVDSFNQKYGVSLAIPMNT